MWLITPPPPIPPIMDTKIFRRGGGRKIFSGGGGRIFRKIFMIDSGRARRADQFDIYQHGVSEAYKWKKIGVENGRPPHGQNCDPPADRPLGF